MHSFFWDYSSLLGTCLAFTTISLWQLPLLLREVFGTPLRELFLSTSKPLAVGIPYGSVVWWTTRNHTPWGWFGLAVEMGLTALLYFLLAWLLVFNQSERSQWNSRLKMLLTKFH